ncbi:MAG: GAF domain-containing protein, partial [Phototrophicaceae bacterium]
LTANLIRDRFNFYYTQVYMIDARGEYAVLREGTGYVGRKLLARGHKLPLDGQSLVARSVRSGAAIVVQDVASEPDFLKNELLPDTRSEVAIPLRSQGEIIGVLDIQHNVVDAFEPSAVTLFQSMADQLAVTFDNVNLLQDTAKRAVELETVAQVGAEAASNLNLDVLLKDVSTLVRNRFNLYHAHIYLMDDKGENLVLAGGAGEAGMVMVAEHRSIPLNAPQSIVARAAREKTGVIVNNVRADENFLPHPMLPDTKSEMAIPMVIGDETIGVLDVQASVVDRFTDEDVRIKTTLASQVAIAVENARAFRRIEEARREIERVYASSIDMIGSASLEGYFLTLNPAWEKTLGFSPEELMAEPFISFVHPDDVESTLAIAGRLAEGQEAISFENRYRCRDGSYRWLSWNSAVDLEQRQIHFVTRDVTAQKEAAIEMERQSAIIHNSNDYIALTDLEGNLVYANPTALQMMGCESQEDIRNLRIANFHDEHDLKQVTEVGIPTAMKEGVWRHENRFKSPVTGALIPIDQTIFVVRDADGNPLNIATIFTDITERKAAEEAVRQNEARFRSLVNNVPGIIYRCALDEHWTMNFISADVLELTGYPESDFIDNAVRTYASVIHPDDAGHVDQVIRNAISRRIPYEVEYRIVRVDGEIRWVSERGLAVLGPDGEAEELDGAVFDVTEAKQAQEYVERSRYRAEVLAKVNAALNMADDEQSILAALADTLDDTSMQIAALTYFDADSSGTLRRINVMAARSGEGEEVPLETFPATRLDRDEFPLVEYAIEQPDEIVFIEDAHDDDIVNDALREFLDTLDIRSAIAIPLQTGDTLHGLLTLNWPQPRQFDEDLRNIVTSLRSSLSSTVATRRSYLQEERARRENARRAAQLATVAQVSAEASTSLDLDALLVNASNLVKERFGLYHAHIYLLDSKGENLVLAGGAGEAGQAMVAQGHNIPINREHSLVALAARSREGVVVYDVTTNPDFMANPLLPDTRSEMALPMVVSDNLVGVMDVQADQANYFDEQDINVMTTLASQIAVAVQNVRSFEQSTRRATELGMVSEVSNRVNTLLDPDQVVTQVAQLTAETFNLYHIHVFVMDDSDSSLKLVAGDGRRGCRHVGTGYEVPLDDPHLMVARVAREGTAQFEDDVRLAEGFVEDPNLPEMRSRLVIP